MSTRKSFSIVHLALFVAFGSILHAQQPATQPTQVEIKIAETAFDPYVGQYEDAANLGGTIFSFFREGDKFYLQTTNQDRIEIFPSAENKFFLKVIPADAEFVRDASGRVTGMTWRQGGQRYQTKRIADVPAKDTRITYTRTEAMIPMRDGVKLFTIILTPENQTENLPVLLERTPYGVAGWTSARLNGGRAELAHERYVFVFQDIRGREDSEGKFEMLRPPRDKRDPKSIDESTDTYDTIEYLLKNVPKNNGRVGIVGVSYGGWLAEVALLDPHPALKASSPQAPVTDLWMGDDFSHHGALRQTYAHQWAVPLESAKKGGDVEFKDPDLFDWYLNAKMPDLAADLATKSHSWKAFLEHPSYDEYWKARAANLYLKDTSVPTLIVGGWWDQEDMYGPLAIYKALEKTDTDHQVNLVMGPWNHGGWGGRGRRLAAVDFGSDTGNYFRREIQAPFFAYHLKGKGTLNLPEASIYRSGTNKWMAYDSWTPAGNFQKQGIYLQASGKLSFEKPTASGEAFDSYVSDPAKPVSYRKRPILTTYGPGSTWYTWLVDDQSFLADRKDVLLWKSDNLTEDVTITGDIAADLFASTSGTDSDWVVKLVDVYPTEYPADPKMANYELMVASEIFRGRYLKSFEKPEALKPNAVNEYTINMRGNDYTFKKGHRIMVQVQSTWFPLYNRNPQKFVPNILRAEEGDYQSATQKVYHSAKYPSHISVSVAK
ncbi:MAG TPA: CocE/NonD family hydrolase, partial [Pyrinomonadaceae bacterium]|nr:CocE/NonD family hydrolase [Pyrinomonadaceae bacterium]